MISTRGRYALRMMIDLAENQGNGFVSLGGIAERQGISRKYLEQIIPVLNRAGFLTTARGFQGGYRLSRAAENYRVGEILRATEGSLAPVACLEQSPNTCGRCEDCRTLPLWQGLEKTVSDYLDSTTLASLTRPNNGASTG